MSAIIFLRKGADHCFVTGQNKLLRLLMRVLIMRKIWNRDSDEDPFVEELKQYSKEGVRLYLQGRPSNPFRIAKACRNVSESRMTYMRDYFPDEEGVIRGINFNKIRIS